MTIEDEYKKKIQQNTNFFRFVEDNIFSKAEEALLLFLSCTKSWFNLMSLSLDSARTFPQNIKTRNTYRDSFFIKTNFSCLGVLLLCLIFLDLLFAIFV